MVPCIGKTAEVLGSSGRPLRSWKSGKRRQTEQCSRKLRFRIVSASSVGGAVRPSDVPHRGKAELSATMGGAMPRGRAGDSVGGEDMHPSSDPQSSPASILTASPCEANGDSTPPTLSPTRPREDALQLRCRGYQAERLPPRQRESGASPDMLKARKNHTKWRCIE